MNWDAIGAFGEVAGAFAVVVTLIYLARQTRTNTKAVAAGSTREVWLALWQFNQAIARDPELKRIAVKSHQPTMQEYSDAEWHEFMAYTISYFSILQADFVSHDLDVGYEGASPYLTAGAFVKSYPAWRRAFNEWASSGMLEPGLIAAIENCEIRAPELLDATQTSAS